MASISQEQLLNDIKTQIYQYVYRSTELSFDSLIQFTQDISGSGNLNWHTAANKEHLINVFTKLNEAISNYTLENGDFRSYLHLNYVNILTEEYLQSLFNIYLQRGYNVDPASIVGAVSEAYTTAPPQNTNFPGTLNTSNEFIPEVPETRLVPRSLYTSSID